ncbi:hypothetical protein NDI56_11155 [Haloarcula sp. S1CR25-12]|uniref:Amphi-Trp domain-containing protein n=1 Tax=Haloarcula saliterrae TaxID=2950534 RepID=A0ABU2FCF7_9EURY|nr:hypothetical protein [Haloarcula sp. S1CR25-12]MDS0259952.1 hypothetical protein [Haloarcula sp. S1CR25-12]
MKDDYKSAVTITNPDEFEAALAAIIEIAIEDDVDVRGAWEFRTDGSTRDWDVNITELAKRFEGDDRSTD